MKLNLEIEQFTDNGKIKLTIRTEENHQIKKQVEIVEMVYDEDQFNHFLATLNTQLENAFLDFSFFHPKK